MSRASHVRLSASRPRQHGLRRLTHELLEDRTLLAADATTAAIPGQTTGLFFNESGASDGYVLFAPNTSNTTYLIDKDGNVVHTWASNYPPGLLGYLLPDGSLIRDGSPHGQGGNGSIEAAGAGGLIERFDWNGAKTWEYSYDSPTHLAHHDFEVMPNGNLLLIAWELKSEAAATQAGRDPSLPGAGYLYPDHIVEVQPDLVNGGGTIVWEWHIWDHLVQQFDASKANWQGSSGVSDHPELIDLNYVSTFDEGGGQPEDWTHSNGIDYNADLDQIVLSVREFSEFWIIDHSTTTAEAASHSGGNSGRGGDLLYRWGNPQAYDRGTPADRILYYQHDAHWIPAGSPGAGDITVFNNGVGRPGADLSQVVEVTPPVDGSGYLLAPGEAFGPETPTWTYTAPAANFSSIISSANRLPNGNTLVDYGVMGNFTEVTPDGQEVWKYVNPYTGFGTLGPTQAIPGVGLDPPLLDSLLVNFTFQAIPYPADYIAQLQSTVSGRYVFYNHSSFDGNNAAANAGDDAAIAPDKTPYLPQGDLATFANVTSYSRGINGIMVDLSGESPHTSITADDFVFRVGNNNAPGGWSAAPAPTSVLVRTNAGLSGADRVEITWADNAIQNQWLEVEVLANTRTGLTSSDLFYWGNKIGDTGAGTPAGVFLTSAADATSVSGGNVGVAPLGSLRDFDRNGAVDPADRVIALAAFGTITRLQLGVINVVATAPRNGDLGLASALTAGSGTPGGCTNPPLPGELPRPQQLASNRIPPSQHQQPIESGWTAKARASRDRALATFQFDDLDDEAVGIGRK